MALQAAFERYGALSTAFPSTNPWNWKGFDRTCEWIEEGMKEGEEDDNDNNKNETPNNAARSMLFLPLLLLPIFHYH